MLTYRGEYQDVILVRYSFPEETLMPYVKKLCSFFRIRRQGVRHTTHVFLRINHPRSISSWKVQNIFDALDLAVTLHLLGISVKLMHM